MHPHTLYDLTSAEHELVLAHTDRVRPHRRPRARHRWQLASWRPPDPSRRGNLVTVPLPVTIR